MSNKEITVDTSTCRLPLDGFKFFVKRVEYTNTSLGPPGCILQVVGIAEAVATNRVEQPPHLMSDGKPADGSACATEKPSASIDCRTNQDIYGRIRDTFGKAFADAADWNFTSGGDFTEEQASRPLKTVIPEGVSIYHDPGRRFTIAYRISRNGRFVFAGVAYCSPKDQFSRRIGRELAIKRLFGLSSVDTSERMAFRLPVQMEPGTDSCPKNGAEWRAVEQTILLGLGLLR